MRQKLRRSINFFTSMNYYQKELVRADLIRYVDALKFAIETFEQCIHLKKFIFYLRCGLRFCNLLKKNSSKGIFKSRSFLTTKVSKQHLSENHSATVFCDSLSIQEYQFVSVGFFTYMIHSQCMG